MPPNTEKCRICLLEKQRTVSLYEIISGEKWKEKYLPAIIEKISGIEIIQNIEPLAVICTYCSNAILGAEIIIDMCRGSSKWLDPQCDAIKRETDEQEFIKEECGQPDENVASMEQLFENHQNNTVEKAKFQTEIEDQMREKDRPGTIYLKKTPNVKKTKEIKASSRSIVNTKTKVPLLKRKLRSYSKVLDIVGNKESDIAGPQVDNSENDVADSCSSPSLAEKQNATVTPKNSANKRHCHATRKYMRTVNRNKSYFFRCDYCTYTTHFATYFRSHLQQTHQVPQPRIFKCTHCPKDFLERRYLQMHILHDHQQQPKLRKFLCAECGRSFTKSNNLEYHQQTHLPKNQRKTAQSVRCEYCSKEYSPNYIRVHVLSMHAAERPHICTLCQATFALAKGLRAHICRCHPTEIYRCPCCEVKFRVKNVYEAHLQRGGCQKLGYNCDYCAWGFKTQERLEKHKLNVHKNLIHLEINAGPEIAERRAEENKTHLWQDNIFLN